MLTAGCGRDAGTVGTVPIVASELYTWLINCGRSPSATVLFDTCAATISVVRASRSFECSVLCISLFPAAVTTNISNCRPAGNTKTASLRFVGAPAKSSRGGRQQQSNTGRWAGRAGRKPADRYRLIRVAIGFRPIRRRPTRRRVDWPAQDQRLDA